MTNKPKGTLYAGVTNNLARRVSEHKNNIIKVFTSKYKFHKLVFYDITAAIEYEKRVKKWNRQWKIELIEDFNPCWDDLYHQILG